MQAQTSPERRAPQPAAPTPSPSAPAAAPVDPDLSITANVTARELRFETVPTPKVEFPGRPRRDTVWEAERTNLPPQVQPGVTYRDLGIRLKITSVFADIERIVAEALGEIPASEDAPPPTDSNDQAQPSSGARRPTTNETPPPAAAPPPPASSTQTPAASPARATTRPGVRTGVAPRGRS
jgi:hypothetical protein